MNNETSGLIEKVRGLGKKLVDEYDTLTERQQGYNVAIRDVIRLLENQR